MDASRFDRLTKRHRECLRGVRQLQGSKEIADSLGIEKSTVDSYLTEAVRLIGARNRRDAALLLADHEAVPFSPPVIEGTPDKMGANSARLSDRPSPPPLPVSPGEPFVGQQDRTSERATAPFGSTIGLPFRRKGQVGNDLSIGGRLIWIQVVILGMAVGFGMLTMGLHVLAGIIERISRLFS